MARPLASIQTHKFLLLSVPFTNYMFFIIGIISVWMVVTFLCASHHTKKSEVNEAATVEPGQKKTTSKLHRNVSKKALRMEKKVSWKKVQDEADHDEETNTEDEEATLWKRKIIKGERCRPLDFSGRILYDENGNLLPDSPHPSVGSGRDTSKKQRT